MHFIFSILSVCLLAASFLYWSKYRHNQAVSDALDTLPTQLSRSDEYELPENAEKSPEVQLAFANALSNGNNLEQAELAFNDLIRQHKYDRIGQAAQFNLANAYLRQGMIGSTPNTQSRSMLELAKQRYRDLLREVPLHWDARYNLERALLLAPETTDASSDDKIEPVKSVRVIVPGFEKKDLP